MRLSKKSSAKWSLLLSVFWFAGCGATNPVEFSPPEQPLTAQHTYGEANTHGDDLLYISSYTSGAVTTYAWPILKRQRALRGFAQQNGLCTDARGNVFIANTNGNDILEYAHGGTKPISTLLDLPNYHPASCAVDPMTGDLAVTNLGYGSYGSKTANLLIYRHAKGQPAAYTIPSIYYYYMCGYDNRGNLLVDGSVNSIVGFAILPRGGSALKSLTLDQSLQFPGGIQWDGKHWAIGDQKGTVYQFDIKGHKGKQVGSTALNGADGVYEFYIDKGQIIAPEYGSDEAQIFPYPAGGDATATIKKLHQPFGAVISHGS